MTVQTLRDGNRRRLAAMMDRDVLGLLALLLVVVVAFGVAAPGFLSAGTFT